MQTRNSEKSEDDRMKRGRFVAMIYGAVRCILMLTPEQKINIFRGELILIYTCVNDFASCAFRNKFSSLAHRFVLELSIKLKSLRSFCVTWLCDVQIIVEERE
jgi:hypothetical protein